MKQHRAILQIFLLTAGPLIDRAMEQAQARLGEEAQPDLKAEALGHFISALNCMAMDYQQRRERNLRRTDLYEAAQLVRKALKLLGHL